MTFSTAFSGRSSEGYETFGSIFLRHYAIQTLMSETLQDLLNLLFKEPITETDSLPVTDILFLSHRQYDLHNRGYCENVKCVWKDRNVSKCVWKDRNVSKWDLFWRLIWQLPDKWWDLTMVDLTYRNVGETKHLYFTYLCHGIWKSFDMLKANHIIRRCKEKGESNKDRKVIKIRETAMRHKKCNKRVKVSYWR